MDNNISQIKNVSFVTNDSSKNTIKNTKVEEKNSASSFEKDSYKPKEKNTSNPFEAKPVNIPSNKPNDNKELRFFFFSDAHSKNDLLEKFIDIANKENPDLIIDGGDIVHDTTEPELDKAFEERNKLKAPTYIVNGNHDVEIRGPITHPVREIPEFQTMDAKGVHFIMIDNESQLMSEEVFKNLENDLEKNKGKTTIVAMHVPPVLSKEPLTVKLGKKLPLNFASPLMTDEAQVKRFTDLMSKYGVSAVLTGHTHKEDYMEKDGVKYINAGATGGLTPGMGIDNEYVDLSVKGKEVEFKRVTLKEGTNNPVKFASNMMNFYGDLNSFNHDKLGWNYIPSASVQYELGTKFTDTNHGSSISATGTATMERMMNAKGSVFGSGTLGVGNQDLNAQLYMGYKHRLVGDYNKGLFVSGAAGVNGGIVAGRASAGVGAKISTGIDYKNFTFSVGQEFATNYKATTASIGFRF